jgi:hypothetical protein
MSVHLERRHAKRLTGQEPLVNGDVALGPSVADFWAWSASDLVSNTLRGVLAEFIVARAVGVDTNGVREEWSSCDLRTPDGITIEVKSAAYLQSWSQRQLSTISFVIPKAVAWNANMGIYDGPAKRQAMVYVFALLAHSVKETLNPLQVDQWRFFVVPTSTLDTRTRSQHSITAKSLERLAGAALTFGQLAEAVSAAASGPRSIEDKG